MQVPHIVYELKPSKTGTDSASRFSAVLSAIPRLKTGVLAHLLNKSETLSFDLIWEHGRLRLTCCVPYRLHLFVAHTIGGWFPDMAIAALTEDPVTSVVHQHAGQWTGGLITPRRLLRQPALQTKPASAFPADSLIGVYASLTALPGDTAAVLQFVVTPASSTAPVHAAPTTAVENATLPSPSQERQLHITLRCAVCHADPAAGEHFAQNIVSQYELLASDPDQTLGWRRARDISDFLTKLVRRHHSYLTDFRGTFSQGTQLFHPADSGMAVLPNIIWGKQLRGEPPEQLPVVSREQSADDRREINPYATTIYKNQQIVYGLRREDRRRHMYVIGKTGTGKSTMLANMAINDLKNGEGLCVIDPHGDLVETLLDYIPSRRINDVIYLDPSDPERTVKLNLFEGNSVVHRELIASGIISVFKKLYGYSWGPRLEHILRNALLTLLKAPDSQLSDISNLLTNQDFRQKIVATLDDDILRGFWMNEFDTMQEKLRTEAIAPVLNKVGQFVSSPLVRDVVNARKSTFDIETVMDEGKILLVNLSQGKLGEDNATLLGAMLITKIQLAAMSRVYISEEERRDFYLYVDEFQNFATESFSKILSEARKYRLNLTLANQYTAQIPEDVQKAIFGNCGSIVSFVMGADDANLFSREFSGTYTPDDLVNLEKHQVVNRISINNVISPAFPARTLPLAASSNQNRSKVIQSSRERYAKKK